MPIHPTLDWCLFSTLGLARNKSKDKAKSRRHSFGVAAGNGTAGAPHADAGSAGESAASGGEPFGSADAAPSWSPSADERPSSEPLGTGVRVYACLFDAVGDIIQAK